VRDEKFLRCSQIGKITGDAAAKQDNYLAVREA
jgi:hypothetical protein